MEERVSVKKMAKTVFITGSSGFIGSNLAKDVYKRQVYGVAAVIWFSIFLKGRCFYSSKYWKFSLQLSLPLIGYSIASQILSVSDRLMISKMVEMCIRDSLQGCNMG